MRMKILDRLRRDGLSFLFAEITSTAATAVLSTYSAGEVTAISPSAAAAAIARVGGWH